MRYRRLVDLLCKAMRTQGTVTPTISQLPPSQPPAPSILLPCAGVSPPLHCCHAHCILNHRPTLTSTCTTAAMHAQVDHRIRACEEPVELHGLMQVAGAR